MPTDIKLKNSVTATNAPTSLQQGEVAINITDKKVWVGNAATTPVLLLGSGADGTFTNLTVSGVASFADGTVSLPSITNIGDTNTGIFFPAADTIAFTEGGVESMRIDSAGNLGLGETNPNEAMVIKRGAGVAAVTAYRGNGTTSTGEFFVGHGSDAIAYVFNRSNQPLVFATNNAERMRIDSSGNVGIGSSSPTAKLQVTGTLHLTGAGTFPSTGEGLEIVPASAGGNNWIQAYSRTASTFQILKIGSSVTMFETAGSERMRIDSSGNLLVGTTSALVSSDTRVCVSGVRGIEVRSTGGDAVPTSLFWNNATAGDNLFVSFRTEASDTQRGTITYNRGAGLVAYNTTSDYRAKDIISPVLDSGEVIDSVPVYMGKMKGATQARPMFIAHETPDYAHTGEKDAVDKDGNPIYQQMDASSLVPVLWAEIQSLRKRIAALESK